MAEKIEFDATGFTSLKSQIREANLEYQALLANVDATPEAVQAAADKVAGLKDQFNDANDAVNALTQQGKFQALTKGLAAVSGGFTAMQGAITLVGGDVKDFEKTFQKLQAAMALTQGLTALADLGDAFGAIKVAAVGAFNSIKAAIGSTGIGLLIVGLGIAVQQLVSYMDELTESEKQNKNATEALSSAIQQQTLDYQSLNAQVQSQLTIDLANAELQKKSIEDIGLPFQICGQKIKWEKIDSDRVADVFHIKLPLPIANTDWTFEVFEWVMKYTKEYTNCEDIRAYPTHIPGSKATEMCIKANIYKQKA